MADANDDVFSAVTSTDEVVSIDTTKLAALVVVLDNGAVVLRASVAKVVVVDALRKIADSLETGVAVLLSDVIEAAEDILRGESE